MKAKLLVYALLALVLRYHSSCPGAAAREGPSARISIEYRSSYSVHPDVYLRIVFICKVGIRIVTQHGPGTYIEDGRVQMANPTIHRSKAGKKLYTVRVKSGRVKDI